MTLKTGDHIRLIKSIRSQKIGQILPKEGTFIRTTESLGRMLILVDFGSIGEEYIFSDEYEEIKND